MSLLDEIQTKLGDHALVMWDVANITLHETYPPNWFTDPIREPDGPKLTEFPMWIESTRIDLLFGVYYRGRLNAIWNGLEWTVRRLGRPETDADVSENETLEEAGWRALAGIPEAARAEFAVKHGAWDPSSCGKCYRFEKRLTGDGSWSR